MRTGGIFVLTSLLVSKFVILGGAAEAQSAYQESGGIVVVEVESAAVVPSWARETSLSGYTGGAYYTWRGPDLFNSPGSGVLQYHVNITTGGSYGMRLHNRHDHPDSTLANDCFTRMDGGTWIKTYSSTRGQWTWHTRHEHNGTHGDPAYALTPGIHRFEISGRSADFSIDRFHLYLPSVANPLDTSRPPSSTTTGTGPAPSPAPAPYAGNPGGDVRDNANGDGCGATGLEVVLVLGLLAILRRVS